MKNTLLSYVKKNILNNRAFLNRINNYVGMLTGRNISTSINNLGTSYTDGERIVLSAAQDDFSSKKIIKEFSATPEITKAYFLGKAVHEAEHINSSDFKRYAEFTKMVKNDYVTHFDLNKNLCTKIAEMIGNSVEDGRIERRVMNRLPGVKKYLYLKNYIAFSESACVKDEVLDLLNNILLIAKTRKRLLNTQKIYDGTELLEILDTIEPIILHAVASDDVVIMFNDCWQIHLKTREFIADRLENQKEQQKSLEKLLSDYLNSSDMINESMNNDKNDVVGNEISPEMEESKDKGGSTTKKGSQNDKTPSSEQNNENKKDSAGECGEKSQQENSKDSKKNYKSSNNNSSEKNDKKINKEILEKLLDDIHSFEKKEEKENASDSARNNQQKVSRTRFFGGCHNHDEIDLTRTSNDILRGELESEGLVLKKEVKNILESKKRLKELHCKKGKLNIKAMTNLVANNDARIFYKPEKSEIDDYVFYVIIDNSGSMIGIKHGYAKADAAIIEKGLKDLIPLKIIAFNSSETKTNIFILKNFDDKYKESLYFSKFTPNHGNCDSFALEYAQKDLEKRTEKHKIIFMLTDGLPCVSYDDNLDPIVETRLRVQDIRKNRLNLIPIAITDNSEKRNNRFKKIYGDEVIFCEIDNLKKEIINCIKKIISE